MKEDVSFDIEDWEVEAELPGEKEICLCSDLSPDVDEHDQLMCAWYTAMKAASELTSIPPPWEENPLKDCSITDDTNDATEAELPILNPEEYFAFDQMSTSAPPSLSASVQGETSDQQAPALIHTDPEKISVARMEAFRRKSTARKAGVRNAHLRRVDRLKLEKSRRGKGGIDMQIAGLQTLPPIDDCIPASPPDLTPMHDHWLATSGTCSESAHPDTLEHSVLPSHETLANCQSALDLSTFHNSHDPIMSDTSAPFTRTNSVTVVSSPCNHEAASLEEWCQEQDKTLSMWAKNTNKPPYTYPELARMALLRKPNTPLTSAEIRNWILDHFAYYRHTEVRWRQGVNSCLSACESFVVVDEHQRGMTNTWKLAVQPRSFDEGNMAFFLSTGMSS